jgi:hypothetical protein
MKKLLSLAFIAFTMKASGQQYAISVPTDTASIDIQAFATAIVSRSDDNFEKAKTLLEWLSNNFAWTETDYKPRTVKEIIVQKGGNCFQLATVYMSMLKELKIIYRPTAEINLHNFSERRGQTAMDRVRASGNRMSVFGQRHNDHRWVEIYDEKTKEWIPADPTMSLIGVDNWLKGRAWFGERNTINKEISSQIIVPFAIFVVNKNNSSMMEENRSLYYLTNRLDALYDNQLSQLPSWSKWVSGIKFLSEAAKKAFEGEENLHNYNDKIEELENIYLNLKKEYLQSLGLSNQ